MVVCLRWLYYHILSSITYISREHWDLVSIICVQSIDVQSMVFANDRIHYGLQVVFVCLQITPSHYHHYADSSRGIELIKCLSGICCWVCVYDWDYSRNYLYGAVCLQLISLNSLRPSDVFVCQWIIQSLPQIMACSLFGIIIWNNAELLLFIQENIFENVVCKMAAILPLS